MSEDELAVEHETAFIRSFIVPERRDRYLTKLRNQKTRSAFLGRLNHMFHRDVDARFVCNSPSIKVPTGDSLCYVLADEQEFDGRVIPASAVSDMLSDAFFGIIVSYIPGRLAVYKRESPAGLVWIERTV